MLLLLHKNEPFDTVGKESLGLVGGLPHVHAGTIDQREGGIGNAPNHVRIPPCNCIGGGIPFDVKARYEFSRFLKGGSIDSRVENGLETHSLRSSIRVALLRPLPCHY